MARVADRTGRYYLADLAADLALPTAGGARARPSGPGGRWLGAGAEGLALRGTVDADALAAVLSGRHPSGRHQLRLRETTVCAYDLTFAAPKSVSALSALGEPDTAAAVRAAHDDALVAATSYVALHAAAVRVTSAEGRTANAACGLVAAVFTHGTSRALDPHLHSHVVVANLAQGSDGRWRALDGRGLYAHAHAAGALYDAALRHGVTARTGLDWSPRASGSWELSSVGPAVLGALSNRRAEILAYLGARSAHPSPSRRARAVAWAATREPKRPAPSVDELRARWRAAAREAGWTGELAIDGAARSVSLEHVDEHRFAGSIFETGSRGVARRDALVAWARSLRKGAPADDVSRCVDMLAEWGVGCGVAERRHAPGAVVPPAHLRALLGPRPASPESLEIWMGAAGSIARYRARWGVRDPSRALGAETRAELAALPSRRLSDHLATARVIEESLKRLGRRRDLERGRQLEVARGLDRGC
ncbi:MAG: relaxase domain-containing protein [Actinomycetota bacterium]|nr:relaxase domain-containing protein [Actinomycetota bacterium]